MVDSSFVCHSIVLKSVRSASCVRAFDTYVCPDTARPMVRCHSPSQSHGGAISAAVYKVFSDALVVMHTCMP